MIRSAVAWKKRYGLSTEGYPRVEGLTGIPDRIHCPPPEEASWQECEGQNGDFKPKPNRQWTFEDLGGLRAEGYIRDSTLDQRDGFGPEIQRHNTERFAESYGISLGSRWYTEFVSGRYSQNRSQFQQLLADARSDLFDVLLVDHTSRFGRNQAECIRHKEELRNLGKVVVFVSQGIISGNDQLPERTDQRNHRRTA